MSFFSMVGSYSRILYIVVFNYEMWLYGETRNERKEKKGNDCVFLHNHAKSIRHVYTCLCGHGEDLITWLQHWQIVQDLGRKRA